MRIWIIAGMACALAAGCSRPAQQSAENEAGGSAASIGSMQPGQYRTTITMLEMNIPGVPADAMRNMNMQPVTTEDCVTSTDIADFAADPMNNADGVSCTRNTMNTAGGRIEGESTCTTPQGTMTMHMTGAYSRTHVEMEIASTSPAPSGAGQMTQRMRLVTDRIGECPAGEQAE